MNLSPLAIYFLLGMIFYLYQAYRARKGEIHIDGDMLLPLTYWLFWIIYIVAIVFRFISTYKRNTNNYNE